MYVIYIMASKKKNIEKEYRVKVRIEGDPQLHIEDFSISHV